MPELKVAHIRKQGQDMIIVPLPNSFGRKSKQLQNEAVQELQMASVSAGLRGRVVPVWDAGNGKTAFIAPAPWHPFFKSISLRFVAANLNRKLSWRA